MNPRSSIERFLEILFMEHDSKNSEPDPIKWENQTEFQRPVVFWLRKSPPQLSLFFMIPIRPV